MCPDTVKDYYILQDFLDFVVIAKFNSALLDHEIVRWTMNKQDCFVVVYSPFSEIIDITLLKSKNYFPGFLACITEQSHLTHTITQWIEYEINEAKLIFWVHAYASN